jgi:hypothetical protein
MEAPLQIKIGAFAFVQHPDIVWYLYKKAYWRWILILSLFRIDVN